MIKMPPVSLESFATFNIRDFAIGRMKARLSIPPISRKL